MEKPTFLEKMITDFETLKSTHPVYSKMPPVIIEDSFKLITKLVKGECTVDTILDGATDREKKSYNFFMNAVQSFELIKDSMMSPEALEEREENSNSFMVKILDGEMEASEEVVRIFAERYKENMLEKENYEELERLKKANKI
jgi:hypothetical protein